MQPTVGPFSLINTDPCSQEVWVPHSTATQTLDLKHDRRGADFTSPLHAGRAVHEGHRWVQPYAQTVDPVTTVRSTQTPPVAPFVLAGHESVWTRFAWEGRPGCGGITNIPALATAPMNLSNRVQYVVSKECVHVANQINYFNLFVQILPSAKHTRFKHGDMCEGWRWGDLVLNAIMGQLELYHFVD